MILGGDVLDGTTVAITAGPEGLILGDHVIASHRGKPAEARVH